MTHSFLTGRKFKVNIADTQSPSYSIPFGVPQGAVISPLLYNIYTCDAPTLNDCQRTFYADDTALYSSSEFKANITRALRNGLNSFQEYFTRWKITINVQKTQAKFFTRRRTREIPRRPLFIRPGTSISWETEPIKYLGLLLDKQATLKQHIQYAINKTAIASRILYPLLNRKSHLSTENKLLLYKVALRPILTYASPVIHESAKTHIKKLQIQQNKILKMCLNKSWRTPTSEIHELADIELISDFMNRISLNFDPSR